MTWCMKCGRKLKRPTASSMGPVCERAMLGSKQKRQKRAEPARDDRTRDLFAEVLHG